MLNDIRKQVMLLATPITEKSTVLINGEPRWVAGTADPLLVQLERSISSQGGYGRGGSEQRARSIMDFDGMELFRKIRTEIHKMLTDVGATVPANVPSTPANELLAWWDRYRKIAPHDWFPQSDPKRQKRTLQVLRGWALTIDARFDPPCVFELRFRCPNSWLDDEGIEQFCGQEWHVNGEGNRVSALVAVAHKGELSCYCRVCGGVWIEEAEIQLLGFWSVMDRG